jgi:parallel beta-helix repeat protein
MGASFDLLALARLIKSSFACFRVAVMLYRGLSGLLAICIAHEASAQLTLPPTGFYHLYVASNGWDSNPGTSDAPFKTIARAAKAALPGTTVHVAPGSYPGGFKTTVSGTATARIYFVSSSRSGARLVPPPDSTSAVGWDNRGDYVDIVGFEVDGTAYQGGTKWMTGIYNGGSYAAIRANHVHHIATSAPCTSIGGSGITADSYYRGVKSDVIGNSVHDIGPAGCRYVHGIYVSTTGTVTNNIVYRIAAAGIHLWHDAHNVIISNNTVAASNTGIIVGGGDFYHTSGPNDNTHVYNNIVYDNKNGISEQGATGNNNSYRNNLVFQNTTANWRLRNGLTHSGTVAAAPQFVGYSKTGTPDFRLRRTSPAIGTGTGASAHATDFDGVARTGNTGYDIGAYQH